MGTLQVPLFLFVVALFAPPASPQSDDFKFSQPVYEASVLEEAVGKASSAEVISVSVVPPKKNLKFHMTSLLDSRSQQFFAIDAETGKISTVTSLDREFMDAHYLKVSAVGFDHTATATVQVEVLDTNDNPPIFEKSDYNASVHEVTPIGTPVVVVRANDLDSGENGRVSYSMRSSPSDDSLFSLDSSSGVLTLRSGLDRETKSGHVIEIFARDGALPTSRQKTANATIRIDVIDDNDHYPEFKKRNYFFSVDENVEWKERPRVGRISAKDKDKENNSKLKYSLIGGNNDRVFEIDQESGELRLLQGLDREGKDTYNLIVRVQDLGNPPKSNTTQVVVKIRDKNDNAPKFLSAKYYQTVSENVPSGFSIVQVKAFDPDDGDNAEVSYKLSKEDKNLPFYVEKETGWIKTRKQLDREEAQSFTFSVDGFDGGKPSLVSNTLVSIEVSDANDNDPVFEEKEYVVAVSEVTTLGDTVVEVKAVDNDEDSQLRYEIVGGNTRNRFTISSQNGRGIVSVAQPLSYRDENNFLITVNAVDKGGRFGTCNIVINIVDANDHAPKFENTPYFADIFEDVPIGSTVLMLFASDQDYSQNAHITYKLDSDSDKFAVDSQTGALTVSEDLDRESVSTYILSVIAEDGGIAKLSDRTELEISVLDVNDNFPVFSRGSYTGTLTENAVVGTKVLRVSATDRDERDNGKIEYKFSNSHDQSTGAFVIDPISGDVRSDKPLDREAKAFYELVVIAYDGGMPEKSAQAMIRIDIVDVNDSPPKFISDELTFWLEENSPYGTRIGQIRVTDADVSENSEITFQLLNSSDSRFFYLGEFQKSGGISLFAKKEFDYERDRREYQIGIRAESAPLRTDANIVINLRDANDNQPELEDFEIVHNTQVDEYQFDVLGRVPAHDADPTGNLTYNFTYGNNADFLLLDHATGEIRLSPLVKSDVNLRAKVGVMVSDGQNDVRANLKLQINYITETMLKNSVTMRIANVTENTFLQPFFSYLQEALSIAIPCSKDEVIIFGIKSGLDGTIIGSINVTFAISVGESNRGEFLASSFVKQRVYLLQDVMEKILDLEVLPFADDICVKEPCLNYEQCATIPKFGQLHEVLSYHSVTFRSINTLLTYSCNCPDGFTGMTTRYTCDTKINLCYSGPCQNGAGCTATESGYTCQCPEGFAGQLCEVDLTKKNCSSELCHSPAECEVKPDNDVGIKCTNCSGNPYFDSLCRLTSRSFSEGAFSAFAALKQRVEFNISLEFVTQSMDGLLFYNGRLNDENDFIALELTKKTLIFHYSTGEEIGTTSVRQGKGFSDGQFHSVEILYDNGDVTLSVDGCDTKLAIKFASDLEDRWKCANQTIVSQRKSCGAFLNHCPKFLDLTGPFLLGGVPLGRTGIRKFATDHFTGCIRNLAIDGRVFNLNDMVFNNGSITGCPEKRNFCKSNPCQNKGTCDDGWSSYLCTCPEGFTGKDCSLEATDIVGLGEQTKLDYRAKLSPVRFPWLQSISFKTSVADGVRELMTVTLGHNEAESVITIEDGIVHYTFEEAKIRLDSSFVADNRWHNIQVKWMLKEIWLNLDYGQHETTSDYYNAFGGKLVTKIRIGKRKGSDALPFIGCVQEIEVGDDDDPRVDLLTQENAQDCKDVTESNLMLPATTTTLSSSSCQLRRRSSQECVSFCDLGLCEGGSSCVEEQMGVSYTCECSDPNSSVGRYCQPKPREVCPRHWWGTPVCGPCNCDAGNGFNETCDASTGECGCKNYHYTEHDEDNEDHIRCLACHCYPTGSLSTSCHAETGQCQCKEGVIGKRCNTCSNKFAELSSDGCKVIYGACPAEYEGDIFWERTQFDSQKTSNCPDSSVGVVTRNCSEGGWGQADFSSCTHKEFLKLQTADPNTESWLTIRTIGSALEKQASFSRRYKNDVTAVYASIDKVLKKEANLTGFQLAHRKDRTFLNNLFKIVSWLLDSDNIKMFEIMKLVLSVHAYGSTVANSMTDTFTHPFEIVTDNVIFGLDTEKTNVRRRRSLPLIGGHAEITYPKYNNFMRSPNAWQTTSLTMDSPSSTIIQYLIVRADNSDLERDLVMIPKVRWNTKLSMFSDVLSFSSSIDAGDRRLQFRSKLHHPQNVLHCVNWNTELDIWSSIDCDTNYERSSAFSAAGSQQSTTTVDCACSEGDAFGVVEEFVGKGQVYFVTSETELLFATFVAISIVILFVTFICLVVLNRQSRNSVSIQRNITSSVLLFQLTYLLAIVFNEDLVDEYITLCKAIAIVLHFTSVSAFSWLFLSSFHIYRMLTELRDINHGKMTFYTAMGYGIPTLVVVLTVGVSGRNYGSDEFCWLALDGAAIWGMIGPELICIAFSLFFTLVNIKTVFNVKSDIDDFFPLRLVFFVNIGIIPLLGILHVSSILLTNEIGDTVTFLYVGISIVLACYGFCGFVLCDRSLWRRPRGTPASATEQPEQRTGRVGQRDRGKSSLSYQQQPHLQMAGSSQMHLEAALSVASTTSHSTSATYKRPYPKSSSSRSQAYIHHGQQQQFGGHHSDTESDMDQRSFDLASSHSSDDDRDYNDLDSMGGSRLQNEQPAGKNNLSVNDYPKY